MAFRDQNISELSRNGPQLFSYICLPFYFVEEMLHSRRQVHLICLFFL